MKINFKWISLYFLVLLTSCNKSIIVQNSNAKDLVWHSSKPNNALQYFNTPIQVNSKNSIVNRAPAAQTPQYLKYVHKKTFSEKVVQKIIERKIKKSFKPQEIKAVNGSNNDYDIIGVILVLLGVIGAYFAGLLAGSSFLAGGVLLLLSGALIIVGLYIFISVVGE